MCSVRRELGCIWGDLLGVWLWSQGFTWCLYQSLSLCTLDKKCHQIIILHRNLKGMLEIFNLYISTQPEMPTYGDESHVPAFVL